MARFDPSTLAQSKERKGSNFAAQHSGAIVLQAWRAKHIQSKNFAVAIWQPWSTEQRVTTIVLPSSPKLTPWWCACLAHPPLYLAMPTAMAHASMRIWKREGSESTIYCRDGSCCRMRKGIIRTHPFNLGFRISFQNYRYCLVHSMSCSWCDMGCTKD